MGKQIIFTPRYLINNQMQLLIAIICADKYFRESEFGLWIFQIGGSCQKPAETRRNDGMRKHLLRSVTLVLVEL